MIKQTACGAIVFMGLVAGTAFAQAPTDARLSDAEFEALTALLDEAQDTLMGLVTGMTDEQWTFRENPDRWSVAECVEHITRSEAALLERIKSMIEADPDPDWFAKSNGDIAMLKEMVENPRPQGQGGVRAPDELEPTEKWDRRHGIAQFYATHGEVRTFVETMDREIKNRTMESSIPQFGSMNAYEWLHLLAFHVVRHSKQIAKVQADPNYPAKTPETAGDQPNPNMTDEELEVLVKAIDDGQDRLLGLITGLTDEQWAFRENPDRWSIGECVEHIARGAQVIVDAVARTQQGPANPNWHEQTKGKIDFVRKAVVTRSPGGAGSTFRAPGEVAPTENWDRERAFREFYQTFGNFRAFAETMDREIKNRTFDNPFPEFGTLNGYDWMTLTALHVIRHSMQIEEVKADPKFPN